MDLCSITSLLSQWLTAGNVELMISSCRGLRLWGVNERGCWASFCSEDYVLGLSATSMDQFVQLSSTHPSRHGILVPCLRCLYWQCSPLRIITSSTYRSGSDRTPTSHPRPHPRLTPGGTLIGAATLIFHMSLCQQPYDRKIQRIGFSLSSFI